ncbi:MAG: YIP1 family protein [Anaerolineales bacterium]|nr:YIP1 family protein [Anaerolineales bacterium]MCA9930119.1 YIP1 family protein [Anaerolineales bacterium]
MSSEAVVTAPRQHFFSLLVGMIISPRKSFSTIGEGNGRSWIIMALLGMVLVTLPVIVAGPITRQQIIDTLAEQEFVLPEGAEAPADFDPTAFAASPITTTIVPAAFGAIGLVFGWVIWSGAFHLISSMAGGRNSFLQMLQIVIWSWVPYGIRNLVQTIYIATSGTLIEHPGLSGFVNTGPPPENPFAATPPAPGILALQSFLQQIDIYLFWNFALITIGIMVIAKLPRRKAMGVILVVWAVFTLIRVGGAAAMGGLAGAFTG